MKMYITITKSERMLWFVVMHAKLWQCAVVGLCVMNGLAGQLWCGPQIEPELPYQSMLTLHSRSRVISSTFGAANPSFVTRHPTAESNCRFENINVQKLTLWIPGRIPGSNVV